MELREGAMQIAGGKMLQAKIQIKYNDLGSEIYVECWREHREGSVA